MYYPSTRLLTVLDLLMTRGQMNASELAQHLEVDARTIRRYISMLDDMGAPVETIQGRHGGYRVRANYKLPPLMFSDDEALALTLGLWFTRRLGIAGMVKSTEAAVAKMERVMPAPLREHIRMFEAALVMEVPTTSSIDSEKIMLLSRAIYEHQQVWIRYRTRDDRGSERAVDPYGLVHRFGFWYLAGYCHLRQDLRLFRADRIEKLSAIEEPFSKPENFDLLKFVDATIARTPGVWLTEVLLKTTLDEARKLVPPTMAMLSQRSEGVIMFSYVENLMWIARFLLSLPCPVEIRAPNELRDELRKVAQRALEIAEGDFNAETQRRRGQE